MAKLQREMHRGMPLQVRAKMVAAWCRKVSSHWLLVSTDPASDEETREYAFQRALTFEERMQKVREIGGVE